VYERLGIPTVATVRWAADQVMRRLLPAGSEPLWRDPSGNVRLVEVHADRGWVGHTIASIEKLAQTRVPFVQRLGQGMVPEADTVFQDGDLLYAAVTDEGLSRLEHRLSSPPDER